MKSVARKGGAFHVLPRFPWHHASLPFASLTMRSADCVQLMNKTRMNADDAIGTRAEHAGGRAFFVLGLNLPLTA